MQTLYTDWVRRKEVEVNKLKENSDEYKKMQQSLESNLVSAEGDEVFRIQKELEVFFEESECDIMVTWKVPIIQAFKDKVKEIRKRELKKIHEKLDYKLQQSKVKAELEDFKSGLAERAREYAN